MHKIINILKCDINVDIFYVIIIFHKQHDDYKATYT